MPNRAHRKASEGTVDIMIDQIHINDHLVIFPNEICPVDGEVIEGHGSMDESYLTGEPFIISKVAGAISQKIIDVFAVLNALRAAFPPKNLTDFV